VLCASPASIRQEVLHVNMCAQSAAEAMDGTGPQLMFIGVSSSRGHFNREDCVQLKTVSGPLITKMPAKSASRGGQRLEFDLKAHRLHVRITSGVLRSVLLAAVGLMSCGGAAALSKAPT